MLCAYDRRILSYPPAWDREPEPIECRVCHYYIETHEQVDIDEPKDICQGCVEKEDEDEG